MPQFGEPNIHVGYDDGDYREVFIRRVVDLDDKRAVVNLTLRRDERGPARCRGPRRVAAASRPRSLALTDAHFAGGAGCCSCSRRRAPRSRSGRSPCSRCSPPRGRRSAAHRATGRVIVVLVLAARRLLFVVAPDDALFAMSPDGPTRGADGADRDRAR